jgi:ABC-type multidrug transport system ATPase subunit
MSGGTSAEAPIVDVREASRRFGAKEALVDVSFRVEAGKMLALLGPNGAGKTTLIRLLGGLLGPSSGSVDVFGVDAFTSSRALRHRIGLIPSGDRSFYLRISGIENLVFFARLYGLSRREATLRSAEVLEHVGLAGEGRKRVAFYSHGMQKRLSVARAMLMRPSFLLVDEATHDLDPEGALRVRKLVRDAADAGAAVVWATQRVDEIRGLADRVILLANGRARFYGTVHELMAHSSPHRHVLHMRNGRPDRLELVATAERALAGRGRITAGGDPEHFVLALDDGVILGDALAAIAQADIKVLSCRQERSEIEEAFFALTGGSE